MTTNLLNNILGRREEENFNFSRRRRIVERLKNLKLKVLKTFSFTKTSQRVKKKKKEMVCISYCTIIMMFHGEI